MRLNYSSDSPLITVSTSILSNTHTPHNPPPPLPISGMEASDSVLTQQFPTNTTPFNCWIVVKTGGPRAADAAHSLRNTWAVGFTTPYYGQIPQSIY